MKASVVQIADFTVSILCFEHLRCAMLALALGFAKESAVQPKAQCTLLQAHNAVSPFRQVAPAVPSRQAVFAGLLTLGSHLEWHLGTLDLKRHLTVGWRLQQGCFRHPCHQSSLLTRWIKSCMPNQVMPYAYCHAWQEQIHITPVVQGLVYLVWTAAQGFCQPFNNRASEYV